MGYRKMNIWKVNEFNFLNEEVEEFTRRWSQILVNVRSLSYLKQKSFEYCFWGINRQIICYIFSFSFGNGDMLLIWVKYTHIHTHKHTHTHT